MAGPRSGNLHTAAANNCRITRKQPSILSEARSRLGGRSVRLATRRNPAADCKRELLQLPMAAGGMAMWHVRPVRSRHRRSPARSFGYGRERGGATSQSGSPRRRPAAEKARQGWRSRSRRPFSSAGIGQGSDLRSGNCWRHPAQRAGRTPRHSSRGRWLPSPRIPIRYRRSGSSGLGGIRLLFFRLRSRFWRVAPRLVHSGRLLRAHTRDKLGYRGQQWRPIPCAEGTAPSVCSWHTGSAEKLREVYAESIYAKTLLKRKFVEGLQGGNAVCSRAYTRPNKHLTDNGAERRRKCPQGHTKRAHARASSLLRGV